MKNETKNLERDYLLPVELWKLNKAEVEQERERVRNLKIKAKEMMPEFWDQYSWECLISHKLVALDLKNKIAVMLSQSRVEFETSLDRDAWQKRSSEDRITATVYYNGKIRTKSYIYGSSRATGSYHDELEPMSCMSIIRVYNREYKENKDSAYRTTRIIGVTDNTVEIELESITKATTRKHFTFD